MAFAPETPGNVLAEVLADAGLRQLHIAETEKYAHVTFFFNGGVEQRVPGRDAHPRPEPPRRAHLRLQAADERREVTDELVRRLESDESDFVVVNFANADMVGHTGVIAAAVTAVETVDACLGRVVEPSVACGGACLVTADHGNSDNMVDPRRRPQHGAQHQPGAVHGHGRRRARARRRHAGDIAPTVLHLLGYAGPPEMTGRDLLEPARRTPALPPTPAVPALKLGSGRRCNNLCAMRDPSRWTRHDRRGESQC